MTHNSDSQPESGLPAGCTSANTICQPLSAALARHHATGHGGACRLAAAKAFPMAGCTGFTPPRPSCEPPKPPMRAAAERFYAVAAAPMRGEGAYNPRSAAPGPRGSRLWGCEQRTAEAGGIATGCRSAHRMQAGLCHPITLWATTSRFARRTLPRTRRHANACCKEFNCYHVGRPDGANLRAPASLK